MRISESFRRLHICIHEFYLENEEIGIGLAGNEIILNFIGRGGVCLVVIKVFLVFFEVS